MSAELTDADRAAIERVLILHGDRQPFFTACHVFEAGLAAGRARALLDPVRSIRIPTETMEQEFQNHYRRGLAAGRERMREECLAAANTVEWLENSPCAGAVYAQASAMMAAIRALK